jgi:hypothetical protein
MFVFSEPLSGVGRQGSLLFDVPHKMLLVNSL